MNTAWDPSKNEANRAKHGLDFAHFQGFDAEPVILLDDRKEHGETRLRAFGRINGLGHNLVFTMRGDDMWIISFRRAHEKEMRRYGR